MSYRLTEIEKANIATSWLAGESNKTKLAKEFNTSPRTVGRIVNNLEKYLNVEGKVKGPRVLLLDIETAPAVSYHWGRWKINVAPSQVVRRPYMITWAAKWLGSEEVMSDLLPAYLEEFTNNPTCDKEIVKTLWRLLDEADIVIGHYLKKFDIPQTNARFIAHGFVPPSPYKMICTKEIAAKHFKFEANSLEELADFLGVGNKNKMDFTDWRNCIEGYGTPEGWSKMLEYNEVDVLVLEKVYLMLRAYDSKHPNVSLYYEGDTPRCTVCGSENLEELSKNVYTQVSAFKSYRCECGHISRTRKNILKQETMKNILTNVSLH